VLPLELLDVPPEPLPDPLPPEPEPELSWALVASTADKRASFPAASSGTFIGESWSGVPSPPLELALEALPETPLDPPLLPPSSDGGAVASAPDVAPESAPQFSSEQRW
jgi:hypothetical protein